MSRASRLARPLPGWVSGALIAVAAAALVWAERRRPLRRATEPANRRDARNLAFALGSAAAVRLAEAPVATRLTALVDRRGWGLVPCLRLPPLLEVALAGVLLDYTLYVWHVLTHRVPVLWRLHRVHHADLDLSATTALRFHALEMLASVPWRAAQIVIIGAAPLALSVWQTATLLAILFHHSNLRLPHALERRLVRLIVTPRMHGIHHSIVPAETHANWGTIFSLPDVLHGTARLDVPQRALTIGVPALRDPAALRLSDLVRLPFTAG